MSICIEYINRLLLQVFKIKYEDIQEQIDNNCRKEMYKQVDSIKLHLRKCTNMEQGSMNRIYKYLAVIKKNSNFIPIINNLRNIDNFIQTTTCLTNAEISAVKEIEKLVNDDLRCKGFSGSHLSRMLRNNCIKKEKLDILREYLFIPMLLEQKDLYRYYLICTNIFLKEKKFMANSTPYSSGYEALILDNYNDSNDLGIEYVKTVFRYLIDIDEYVTKYLDTETEIWKHFDEYVKRACYKCDCVTEQVLKEIKDGIMQTLKCEKEFYEKVLCGEKKALVESNFQCIGLYHISNRFLSYMNTKADKNSEFYIIAMRLCSYAAEEYQIFLHPMSTICAPCVLAGKHIFVGPGSVIGSGCYLEENVIIAGCPENEENREVSESSVTIIGEKTTIRKNTMLVAGVTVGKKCVIDENAILVRSRVDDKQFIKSDHSTKNLWRKEDYCRKGGYNYEEE